MSGDVVAALGPGHLAVLRLGPDGAAPVHLELVAPTRNLALLRGGSGAAFDVRCEAGREARSTASRATPRLVVTPLDADLASARMDFDPFPVPEGQSPSPWTLGEVRALFAGDDGRSVEMVVAGEGALRVVRGFAPR